MTEVRASVDALVREAAGRLGSQGIPEPMREAWRIWGDLRGEQPAASLLHRAQPAAADMEARFRAAVARRAAGEPLAYVTGVVGFRRLTLRADRRALIPRPETEGLVELLLARRASGLAVDVGTGTGCIALALADEGRYRVVLGVDRSAEALALAAENRAATGLAVHLIRGDLVSALGPARCDALVSNPPYLTAGEYAGLEPQVRDWEPAGALESGPDGLDATRRLMADAARVLRPGGWLGLEVDMTRAAATAQLAVAAGLVEVSVHQDLFGRARYVLARRSEAE